jgi:hypothetical protein
VAEFAYDCACGKRHEGSPHAVLTAPDAFTAQSEEIRAGGQLSRDFCNYRNVVGSFHFTRAFLPIKIRGSDSYFVWNLWVRLAQEDYERYLKVYEKADSLDEFLSAMSNSLPFYPSTDGMPIKIKRQPGNVLPVVTVAMMDHPLAVDCRDGLSVENAVGMATAVCPEAIRQAQSVTPPAVPPATASTEAPANAPATP